MVDIDYECLKNDLWLYIYIRYFFVYLGRKVKFGFYVFINFILLLIIKLNIIFNLLKNFFIY